MQGQLVGKYRLVRPLGEGGMGVVWEAERENLGGRVALKILRAEYAQQREFAARFFNEAHACNAIDHPAIVKIFDHGQTSDGAAFLAMEYVAGESLASRLERTPRLPGEMVMRLGRQIASAIAAAHRKQIIHRDLKPENIMIVADDDSTAGERVKILDFGIAKIANQARRIVETQGNIVMGTPTYMSPEQCAGGKGIDEKTDVYSLGILMYQMLAGRTPFVADEPGMYIGMHLFKEPPPLGSSAPEAPPLLVELVHAMLAKEPPQRPAMAQVAATLQQLSQTPSGITKRPELPEDFTAIVLTSGDMPFVAPPAPESASPPGTPARESGRRPKLDALGPAVAGDPMAWLRQRGRRLAAVSLAAVVVLGLLWLRGPTVPRQAAPTPTLTPTPTAERPGEPSGASDANGVSGSGPGKPAGEPGERSPSDSPARPSSDEAGKPKDERGPAKAGGPAKRPSWSQEDTDRLLIQARGKSAAGQSAAAMNDAYLAAQRGNAANAWAMAGVYACSARNPRIIAESMRHLEGKSGDRFWLTYLVSQCEKRGYQQTPDHRLRLPGQ